MPLIKKKESKKSTSDLRSSNGSVNGGLDPSVEQPEWMEVQLRVYTNWIKDKVQDSKVQASSLAKDLGDGLVLIKLLEKLSGKKIPGK